MAKQSGSKGGETSRVKLVVLEAEIGEGADFATLAQALSNALRPQQVIQTRIITAQGNNQGLPSPQSQAEEDEGQDQEIQVDDQETITQPRKPRVSRPRRPTVPVAVELDAEAVSSWKAYAASKEVDSDLRRFLVVAAWFHEHRNNEPIQQGHVYACYRHAKWPVGIPDFGQPLRRLKHQQKLNGDSKDGYLITQIGLQEVHEMDKSVG